VETAELPGGRHPEREEVEFPFHKAHFKQPLRSAAPASTDYNAAV